MHEDHNENQSTNRHWLLDSIHAVGSNRCSEQHNKERMIFAMKEIEDLYKVLGIVEVSDPDPQLDELREKISKLEDKVEKLKKMISLKRESRIKKMRFIAKNSPDYDEEMWCDVKHWSEVVEEDFEVWQSTNDDDALDVLVFDYNILAGVLEVTYGYRYTGCMRCLGESLGDKK